MKMVTINIGKKEMIFFSVIILVFAIAGVAIAVGDFSVMGHTLDELDLPSCDVGEALVMTASGWDCGVAAGGTSTVALGSFGGWVDLTSQIISEEINEVATTDGIIVASSTSNGGVEGYTSGVLRVKTRITDSGYNHAITFPVKSGESWRVVFDSSDTETVYWMPIESSSGTLENCAWTDYGVCGAASGGPVLCSNNKVVNGVDSVGCSTGACADSTRCEKVRLYCCDIA